jgi:hypothetical protein
MAKKQAFESERIQLNESPDQLEIVISGKIPGNQFNLLSIWLFSWTAAGVFVLTQVTGSMPKEQRMFMLIWLVFWAYFEFKIGTAWVWRKYGREVFILGKVKTQLRFEVPVRSRASEFETADIESFTNLEEQKGLFVKNYYSSFWVKGGETIGFTYKGRLYSFGRQLSAADSQQLIQKLNSRISRR